MHEPAVPVTLETWLLKSVVVVHSGRVVFVTEIVDVGEEVAVDETAVAVVTYLH